MPVLFLIVFVDLVGFGLVIPLLPFYAQRFDASPLAMTTLFATYSLMAMLSGPFWGRLSDRIGRRPVLIASMAAASLAYLWLAFANALWMLFAARAFAGACAGNIAAAQAYIADITAPDDRARGMGLVGAAFGLGFIIGPVLGGLIAGDDLATADLETPGLIAAALSFIAVLGVVFVLSESSNRSRVAVPRGRVAALRDALTRPVLARLLAAFFLMILALSALETTFAWWAIGQFGWGPRPIGFVFFYVGLMLALMQGVLVGPLSRRFGEERLLPAGLLFLTFSLFALPFAHNVPELLLVTSVQALALGAAQPSFNSLISRCAGAGEQGEVMGVAQSVGALSRVLGPLIAGALFNELGRGSPFLAGGLMAGCALAIAWRLRPAIIESAAK